VTSGPELTENSTYVRRGLGKDCAQSCLKDRRAVRDGRLVRNVAEGVRLPRILGKPKRFVPADQVQALANACAPYGR
jgi:hypothetical protein